MSRRNRKKTSAPSPTDTLETALEDAGDRLADAGADALDSLAEAGTEALGTLTGAADESLADLFGGDVEEIPEIVDSPRLQSALGNSLHFLGTALAEQAAQAITVMSTISADLAGQAVKVVVKMEEIGQKVATKQISPETGEVAIENYLHALQLYKSALSNTAKVEAYKRSTTLLATTKSVLFSVLRMGLQAALPSVGNALNELNTLADDLRAKQA